MTGEIIYCHPKGRFVVRRYTFPPGIFGEKPYSYCETEMTPEQDGRGLCCDLPGYTAQELYQPRREDVKIRKMTGADEKRICDMFRAGRKPKEIAEMTGFRTDRILKLLTERGLREKVKKKTVYTDEEIRLIYALYAQGWSMEQIGRKIGRTGHSVRRAIEYRKKGK